jgi:GDPmannose 4,6-dehydratase
MDPAYLASVADVIERIRPNEIYNLSAQSSVGTSFRLPIETLNSIANSTLNILEVARLKCPAVRLYNASSSEMFGDTAKRPANEETSLRPRSPYGIAKAAAHWMVKSYRAGYGLYACSGIMFNHESPLRHESFVTQKIVRAAVEIARGGRQRLCLGNISILRDWGWAPEFVEAMWMMLQRPQADDFVIATGFAASLEDFVHAAFATVGLDWRDHVDFDQSLLRPFEVDCTVGNPSKAVAELGWKARSRVFDVVAKLLDAELDRRSLSIFPGRTPSIRSSAA